MVGDSHFHRGYSLRLQKSKPLISYGIISVLLAKLAAPLPDRFIGHEDPAGEQQLFHIPVAQAEAEVEPDAMADDLGRKPMVCVRVG